MGTTMTRGAMRKAATTRAATRASIRSAPETVEADEARGHGDHDEGGGEEHDGQRGGEAPGEELLHLLGDDLRGHHVARAPEEHGRHVEAEAEPADEQAAVDD